MANPPRILVTGASGHLGRRVVELLLEASGRAGAVAVAVVAASRTPDKLADLARRGAALRVLDFEKRETLADAFRGIDRMLLVSTDALDKPGRRLEQHRAAVAAAVAAGVKHVAYTSLTNPGPESPILLAPDHDGTEAALKESGIGHTSLRNNCYADLFLASLPHAVATGKLFAAAGTGAVGYVSREDCARAAVAVLLKAEDSARQILDVTGPELVTQAEVARIASEVTGRPVEYVNVTVEEKTAGLVAAGLPPAVAKIYSSFDVAIAKGTLAVVAKTVENLTGRAPKRLADFLREHRAALLGA